VELAKRRIEREEQLAAVDAEYAKLKPPAAPYVFDPVEEAKRRAEREDQRAKIDEEYAKLRPKEPPKEPPFDPVEVARKRVEREEQLAAVDAEYAKLKPTAIPVFDPVAEAKKRFEGEKRRKEVDKAYEEMYGEAESSLDKIFSVVSKFRGSIGGIGGPLVGAALDIMSGLSELSKAGKKGGAEKAPQAKSTVSAEVAPQEILEVLPAEEPLTAEVPVVESQIATAQDVQTLPKAEPIQPGGAGSSVKDATGAAKTPGKAADLASAGQSATKATAGAVEATAGAGEAAGAAGGAASEAAGAAGGAVGGLAAAGAAVPIAGIVLAAKAVQDALVAAVIGGIKSAIGAASTIANTIASADTDPSVPIAKLGETASAAGDKLSSVVPIVGVFFTAIGESTKALSTFMQAVDATAKRYGQYSPEISYAQAIAEVTQTLGDLRRAQELGPEMANYIRAQSELQQTMEDIKANLLVKLLPVVTKILQVVEGLMDGGGGIIEVIGELVAPLSAISGTAAEMLGVERDKRIKEVKDPTETILNDPRFYQTQSAGGYVPDR
jgi:hypothetical protein